MVSGYNYSLAADESRRLLSNPGGVLAFVWGVWDDWGYAGH